MKKIIIMQQFGGAVLREFKMGEEQEALNWMWERGLEIKDSYYTCLSRNLVYLV